MRERVFSRFHDAVKKQTATEHATTTVEAVSAAYFYRFVVIIIDFSLPIVDFSHFGFKLGIL